MKRLRVVSHNPLQPCGHPWDAYIFAWDVCATCNLSALKKKFVQCGEEEV